jgi:hypothetical protein
MPRARMVHLAACQLMYIFTSSYSFVHNLDFHSEQPTLQTVASPVSSGPGKKGKICCRNGKKVVEIRKAMGFNVEGSPDVGMDSMDGNRDTSTTDNLAVKGKVIIKVNANAKRKEQAKANAKAKATAKKKANAQVKKKGPAKRRGTVKGKGPSETKVIANDTTASSPQIWKTDGKTPDVHPQAASLIMDLASIYTDHHLANFQDFLHHLRPPTCTRQLYTYSQDGGIFAFLISQCEGTSASSSEADFFHMIALMKMALYIES